MKLPILIKQEMFPRRFGCCHQHGRQPGEEAGQKKTNMG
jgi:hypothetical protein